MRLPRLMMGTLYIVAGTLHFLFTRRYLEIMPPHFPAPRMLVLISGAAEVAGGIGILASIPQVRRAAAWGLIALLIAVTPANIYMVTNHQRFADIPLWLLVLRLPLQLPLIYWAWTYTRSITSPRG